jgi:hypothetical protein
MTAFATGKGRYGVQAAIFALRLVMVVMFVTRRSQGAAIVVAGLVALSIFGLAGTAYVWWRSRRKVIIGVTSDGLTVNQRTSGVFSFVDGKLGPWVNMGLALHLQCGSHRFVLGGRDRRIAPATRLDAPPVQAVDAWLWVSEFDELLAMGGRRSGVDVRGPALGEPTRCLLFPNPYLAEQMGLFSRHCLSATIASDRLIFRSR